MRSGKTAPQALAALLAADDHVQVRQVAMVDAAGRVIAHTGGSSIAHACDRQGDGFSVQANLMLGDGVCDAMFAAFSEGEGDLAERLMLALEAAQGAGGDIRGRQSAALLVVHDDVRAPAWGGRAFDLRIEDHATPLRELRRLLTLARAYDHMNRGDEMMTRGDVGAAVEAYGQAEALAPDSHEMIFWHAATLAGAGEVDRALPLFQRAFALWPAWRTLVPRLPAAGLLPDDPSLIERILAVE
jgi:uncharacterized Ntn-hydrolase superfamily protein